jgi:hypothetical protein
MFENRRQTIFRWKSLPTALVAGPAATTTGVVPFNCTALRSGRIVAGLRVAKVSSY